MEMHYLMDGLVAKLFCERYHSKVKFDLMNRKLVTRKKQRNKEMTMVVVGMHISFFNTMYW